MIEFIKGSATQPVGDGSKIIAHICNDIGAWGAGFVLAVSKDHPSAEKEYRKWSRNDPEWQNTPFVLGEVQFVRTTNDITVANMIAQRGVMSSYSKVPIRYISVITCLSRVADYALEHGASVHMPRIGCGLAGGTWSKVEKCVKNTLERAGVPVFVYDYEPLGRDSSVAPWRA